jgi:transposase
MRGSHPSQGGMFSFVSPDSRVPATHPLRRVKQFTDIALRRLSRDFEAMYSRMGRPSIPPEWLLKAQILMALFSVRSDRLFCEMLDYNILFRWFLDMDLDTASFDHSVFSKNRDRLMEQEIAHRLMQEVVRLARSAELLSDEHFTVDGTLIEAWASMKSFKRKDAESVNKTDDDPSNPSVDFHHEKRSNETHQSSTDPEALLARKNKRTGAQLAYSGHVLMENRNGLCVDIAIAPATGTAERDTALALIKHERRRGKRRMKTVGADKGYHATEFIKSLRRLGVKPHIAEKTNTSLAGLDGRTTRHKGYSVSQLKRKRVEEIFGWIKSVGGLRKTRVRGIRINQTVAYVVAAAYNLIRMVKLMPQTVGAA